MRTTVRLNDELLRDTKRAAAETGRTLTGFIEDALREKLLRRSGSTQKERIVLITDTGRGPLPGVDLDHSAALLDLLEESDGSARR